MESESVTAEMIRHPDGRRVLVWGNVSFAPKRPFIRLTWQKRTFWFVTGLLTGLTPLVF